MCRSVLLILSLGITWSAHAASGQLLSIKSLPNLTIDDIKQQISSACPGISEKHPLREVKRYQLTYETVDTQGRATTASGLLMFPEGQSSNLPLISYQHSTTTERAQSPSLDGVEGRWVGACFSANGYAVAVADYLGLGVSMSFHPWYHAKTLASASADMLRATKQAFKSLRIQLGSQLYLLGFSQGGHATMALHRHLEKDLKAEFRVTASAPISGPYALENVHFLKEITNPTFIAPTALAFMIYSMNNIYGMYPSLDKVMKPEIAEKLPDIFNGQTDFINLPPLLPDSPEKLLQPEFMQDAVSNDKNVMRIALRKNEAYDWKPKAPIRLYFGEADQNVLPQNAQVAFDRLRQNGAKVSLVNVGKLDHHGSAKTGYVLALQWFDSLLRN